MIDWYYRDEQSHKVGPLTAAEFEVCVAVGEVGPDTHVWRSGLTDWTTYAELLALESETLRVCRSWQSARAPLDSSYHTLIALGASAVNGRPRRSRVTTSGCTPFGVAEPQWLSVPVDRKLPPRPAAKPLLPCVGADAFWLGRQLMNIALAGAALVLLHGLWADLTAQKILATPASGDQPTVVLGPLAPALTANSALESRAENGR